MLTCSAVIAAMPFRGVLALRHASATLSGPRKGERKTAILFMPLDLAGLRNDILLPRHYNAFSAQVSVEACDGT